MKKQPIHRTPDPKGRSIRKQQHCQQTADAPWNGYRSYMSPQRCQSWLWTLLTKMGSTNLFHPTLAALWVYKAFLSNSGHCCESGLCKQTEHGLFTTVPQQNSSHLSQQEKGKRAEFYPVYTVGLFDWLTQTGLFFKDKSVSLCTNCAHATKMKDEFMGRSLQKGRKPGGSMCRGTFSKEHKSDFALLLFHLKTWRRTNLKRLQSLF